MFGEKKDAMTFGSLFAGIGGFDLGFERAGMTCNWQVEINPYSRGQLERIWPHVKKHDDVRTFPPSGEWTVDVICGGFPCQDISNAGHKAGITGERSGLWKEYARIIRDLRPRYVVVENVAALLVRGMETVLGDFAGMGFDAEWGVVSACAMGAPHMRRRLWIVANSQGSRRFSPPHPPSRKRPAVDDETRAVETLSPGGRIGDGWGKWWLREPSVARVDHGLSAQLVDGPNRALGNAVCPPIAEWIGRGLMETTAFTAAKTE